MKYKTTGTRAGHKIFVRKRETSFDNKSKLKDSSFGRLEDHKEMKTYEYAAFQKELFKEKAKQRRKRIIIIAISAVIVIIILLLIPAMIKAILDPSYTSVIFQD